MELLRHIILYFTLVLAVPCAWSDPFCDLAQRQCSGKWELMTNLSVALNNDSIPSNALKPLRSSILQIRDVLDIFPFCFPTQPKDIWRLLRSDANVGYTLLGDFIDLQNVNYSATAELKLKLALLGWLELFTNHAAQYQYQKYFESPDISQLYFRKQSEYSVMFWGNTSSVPSNATSGLDTIGLLMVCTGSFNQTSLISYLRQLAQVGNLASRYDTLCSFSNLTTVGNANYMHDYKKQLRALLNVVKMFPDALLESTNTDALLQLAAQCYAILDKTHATIVPYLYYLEAEEPVELAYSEILVDKAFYAMKQWLEANAWPDWLMLFSSLII